MHVWQAICFLGLALMLRCTNSLAKLTSRQSSSLLARRPLAALTSLRSSNLHRPPVGALVAAYSSSTSLKMAKRDDQKVVLGATTAEEEEDVSVKGRLKLLWKRYGLVAIGTYLGIYVSVLSSVFYALDYDVFRASTLGLDPVAAVKKVCDLVESATGNTSLPGYIRENPRVGTFAVAWVMTKFTEPLRLLVAVSITPAVARFLRLAPPKDKTS